jgi:hypothetical protein
MSIVTVVGRTRLREGVCMSHLDRFRVCESDAYQQLGRGAGLHLCDPQRSCENFI